jgi:hypothetical protein
MKKLMSIAAIALFMAGSSVFACDTCGCKAEKAEAKCTDCTADKKCEKCAKKSAACTAGEKKDAAAKDAE